MNSSFRWKALAALGTLALTSSLFAGSPSSKKEAKEAERAAVLHSSDADTMRVEGEKRFHANCGRCHTAPQKFPPRMMGTVLRHMRVRATITEEDRRMILFYMTQ
jgi:mono/diheme cytochrome c family protein